MTTTGFRIGQARDAFPHQSIDIVEVKPIHNRNFKRRGHRKGSMREWDAREFIAWDGEGIRDLSGPQKVVLPGGEVMSRYEHGLEPGYESLPQPYVMLANSKGGRIRREEGLSSRECFELILETKQEFKDSIFVGFGFNYDINQMLKDIPLDKLSRPKEEGGGLYEKGTCCWGGYWMEWRPGKHFIIRHGKTKRSAIIYDVFGFFQSSFLQACKEYLGAEDPDYAQVEAGKEKRNSFTWEELDDFIIPYNNKELRLLVRVMNQLRQDLHEVGIDPSRWHGPGAIANEVLRKYQIRISRTVPEEVLDAAQYAYAGGRFEHYRVGRHAGSVYEYDIHSAYPAAAIHLPDLSDGTWEYVKTFEPGTFGVWSVDYSSRADAGEKYCRPEPLFCRGEDGSISYPCKVSGWYWTPEASLVADSISGGWVFRPGSEAHPFAFIRGMYDDRRVLKSQGRSAQRALKLILNSLYGKLAQTVGGTKTKPPRWHQLEYAGYITSYTRAMIYKAILLNPSAIIAVETDAVFSTEPLDLPVSDELGDWERKEYTEIVYLQSGFYYATKPGGEIVCKYRGMDRDGETMQPVGLPYRTVLDHLARRSGQAFRFTPSLRTHTTRFIGLGMGLRTSSTWRSWETEAKKVALDHQSWCNKRYHLSEECPECSAGLTMNDRLHTMKIGGYAGNSYARSLPWRHLSEIWHEAPDNWEEWLEVNGTYQELEEADRWN